ncbi:MAG: hypothetical protein JJ957_15775 [Pseudomonadales bacterium]|nr:hypothetical protein [Pseudomonadales bacterium]MBO6597246.1 hypothetical protein [Pseudomonadales bacterium]MBO6823568.1 hypothetical protein [Pseudomonadales bacterium]
MSWQIWIWIPIVYGMFCLWYFNWRGPLTKDEIDKFLGIFSELEANKHTELSLIRKFLEDDDGNEFVMLNLIQLHEGKVLHPVTGESQSPRELLTNYFKAFSFALIKRGGHPVLQARTAGGNIDSWNAELNVGFSLTSMMRYKSRRDLVELLIDPAFADSHLFKLAAIERTISYPTQTLLSVSLRPPVAVLTILLMLASIAQNVAFLMAS